MIEAGPMMDGINHRRDAEALAILAATVLGLTENGELPESLKNQRPGVLWALKQAQHRHGWVVCSPDPDAMSKLIAKHE